MTKTKIFTTVLIIVIAIAILSAGGFTLYRFGYAQGLSASVGEIVGGRFSRDFGDRFTPGFGGHFTPELRRGGLPMFGMRQPFSTFPLFRGIFGLLLLVGVVALVVIGINSLIRRNPSSKPQADSSSPVETMVTPSSEGEAGGGAMADSSESDA